MDEIRSVEKAYAILALAVEEEIRNHYIAAELLIDGLASSGDILQETGALRRIEKFMLDHMKKDENDRINKLSKMNEKVSAARDNYFFSFFVDKP